MQRILLILALLLSANLVNANPRYLEVLDPVFYMNKHPDLKQAFGGNIEAAKNHWMNSGVHEGRDSAPWFSTNGYCQRHPDLAGAFGNCSNKSGLVRHFLDNGRGEGRDPSASDRNDHRHWLLDEQFYLDNYADLKHHFGNDHSRAINHWFQYGIKEGRQGSYGFSPSAYLGHNPDLLAHFGLNYAGAVDHFRDGGRKEGRKFTPEFRKDLAGKTIAMNGDGRIFVVDIHGRRAHITSPQASAKCGFNLSAAIRMDRAEFLRIAETSRVEGNEDCAIYGAKSPRLDFAGMTVAGHGRGETYIVDASGKRRYIANSGARLKCKLDTGGATRIDPAELDRIAEGAVVQGNEECSQFGQRPRPEWAGKTVQGHGDSRVFVGDRNGNRLYIPHENELRRCGMTLLPVLKVNMVDIHKAPDGGILGGHVDCNLFPRPNPAWAGRVIAEHNSPHVYMVDVLGNRRHVISGDAAARCGLDLGRLERIDSGAFNGLPDAGPFDGNACHLIHKPRPEWTGWLVRAHNSAGVNVIGRLGKRWLITAPHLAAKCGLNLNGHQHMIHQHEMDSIPIGGVLDGNENCAMFPHNKPEWAGRLVRGQTGDGKVYVIDPKGLRRHILNAAAAAKCSIDLGKLDVIPLSELEGVREGGAIDGNNCHEAAIAVDKVAIKRGRVDIAEEIAKVLPGNFPERGKVVSFLNILRGSIYLNDVSAPDLPNNNLIKISGEFDPMFVGNSVNNAFADYAKQIIRGGMKLGNEIFGIPKTVQMEFSVSVANGTIGVALGMKIYDKFVILPSFVEELMKRNGGANAAFKQQGLNQIRPQFALDNASIIFHLDQQLGAKPSASVELTGEFFHKPSARDPWLSLAPTIALDHEANITFGGEMKGVCGNNINANTTPDSCQAEWNVFSMNTLKAKSGVLKLTYNPKANAFEGIETAILGGKFANKFELDMVALTDLDLSPGFGFHYDVTKNVDLSAKVKNMQAAAGRANQVADSNQYTGQLRSLMGTPDNTDPVAFLKSMPLADKAPFSEVITVIESLNKSGKLKGSQNRYMTIAPFALQVGNFVLNRPKFEYGIGLNGGGMSAHINARMEGDIPALVMNPNAMFNPTAGSSFEVFIDPGDIIQTVKNEANRITLLKPLINEIFNTFSFDGIRISGGSVIENNVATMKAQATIQASVFGKSLNVNIPINAIADPSKLAKAIANGLKDHAVNLPAEALKKLEGGAKFAVGIGRDIGGAVIEGAGKVFGGGMTKPTQ